MKKLKQRLRYNIYYSSPYYYLYDGDDNGELILKSSSEIDILEKQKELEEKNNDKKS